MGFKLLKFSSKRSINSSSRSIKTNDDSSSMSSSFLGRRFSSKSVDDTTESESCTSSDRSIFLTSKGIEVETMAQKKQFDKILKLVSASSLEDWIPEPIDASTPKEGDSQSSSESTKNPAGDNWPFTTAGDGWPCGVATPLHLIMPYKPPLPIVEEMIRILRTQLKVAVPEDFPDHLGRTPLHVAIAHYVCSEEMAQLLLSGGSLVMPIFHLDTQRRTPLHLACMPIVSKKKNRKFLMAQFNQKMVSSFLVQEFPEAITMRDVDGKTPLDYARESTLAAVVPRLERAAQEHAVVPSKLDTDDNDKSTPFPDWMPSDVPGTDSDDVSTIVSLGL